MYMEKITPNLTFSWQGAASLLFHFGKQVIAVDPFISRPGVKEILTYQMDSQPQQVKQIFSESQTLLISHTHHDHFMDVPEIMRFTNAEVYGPRNVSRLLRQRNIDEKRVHIVKPGDTFLWDDLQVWVTAARHARILLPIYGKAAAKPRRLPLQLYDYKMDAMLSYRFRYQNFRIAIQAIETAACDLMFILPFNIRTLKKNLLKAKPRVVVPIHWDNFMKPLQNQNDLLVSVLTRRLKSLEDWIAEQNLDTAMVYPEPFKEYSIPDLLSVPAKPRRF